MPIKRKLHIVLFYALASCFGIRKQVAGLLILFTFSVSFLSAQDTEEKIISAIDAASDDSTRILSLSKLAAYYFDHYQESRGDSILSRQIQTAEASRNQRLLLWVFFNNPLNRVYDVKNNKRRAQNKAWFQHAFDYAKNNALTDYMALAYCRLSAYELEEGNMDKGLEIANLAITTTFASVNDSVKSLCALQLGNTYLLQGNVLMSFKAFNNAYDLALKANSKVLVAEVYRAISAMYKSLGQTSMSIDYLFRSLEVFQKEGYPEEVAGDYIALGKLYNYDIARDYLLKAEKIADSLKNKNLKLEAQKILFSYIMTKEKPPVSLQFLHDHPQLVAMHEHNGPHYTDWMYGELFLYGGMPDSARYYFEKAAPFFDSGYSINQQKDFFGEMADCYYLAQTVDLNKAIFFKEKALLLCKQVSSLREIKAINQHLSDLYERKGNLAKALYFDRQYDLYKDSVNFLTKDKDLALLEIGNETKRKNELEQHLIEKTNRLHNLQYMVITISVLTGFVLMLFLGFFKLSKLTIKVMGFLSFISFFEFIIMLLDHYIHDITGGEPLKVWLIKIVLLSFLLPLHHFLEEKFIAYLLERDLIHTKNFVYLRKLMDRYKKSPAAKVQAGEEINLPEELPDENIATP